MAATRRAVLLPTEGTEATRSPEVRGGKGAGLAEMVDLGLPVPPFFTIPTGICRAYMEHGKLPERFGKHLERGIAALEKETGRKFGSADNPLLVSVRSGAPTSMPGMMDTVLNVGFNAAQMPETLTPFEAMGGKEFAQRIYCNFMDHFGRDQWPIPDPQAQLRMSIMAVLDSWNSERAKAYREHHGIQGWVGTAVNIQAMVFGNLDDHSGTGVVFSSNPSTGQPGMSGEWLPRAQGEEIVSGARTPEPICNLKAQMPAVYAELEGYVEMLSNHIGGVVDVEFTVEAGKLYILQYRSAKVSPVAAATLAVRAKHAKRITREEAVASLTAAQIRQLGADSFSPRVMQLAEHHYLVATGLPASPGAAVGMAVYSSQEAQEAAAQGIDVVLVRPDTSPDDLPGMLVSKAIVTGVGGETCHAALVARDNGIPAVVGAGELPQDGGSLSVDGTSGRIFRGMLPLENGQRTKEVNLLLKWVAMMEPEPSLDFGLLEQRFCMNTVLNDFYLSEKMAQASRGSSLEGEATALWRRVRNESAVLIATYLVVAISGEMRHFYDGSCSNPQPSTREKAEELFSKFLTRGYDRSASQMCGVARVAEAGQAERIRFAQLMTDVFADPGWPGSSIGGQAWAEISRALLNYLNGSWKFATFVDHAFDLRHNGGVLFNKHLMVSSLTPRGLDRLIPAQLEAKKHAPSIRALRDSLANPPSSERYSTVRFEFSPEVDDLWEKGETLGLW
jgi:pyruvate,orthophosphate dikinase